MCARSWPPRQLRSCPSQAHKSFRDFLVIEIRNVASQAGLGSKDLQQVTSSCRPQCPHQQNGAVSSTEPQERLTEIAMKAPRSAPHPPLSGPFTLPEETADSSCLSFQRLQQELGLGHGREQQHPGGVWIPALGVPTPHRALWQPGLRGKGESSLLPSQRAPSSPPHRKQEGRHSACPRPQGSGSHRSAWE